MQQINLKLLNPEVAASERFAKMAEGACGQARRWAASAVDAGLADLLRPQDDELLRGMLERVRDRAVLSPELSIDAVRLAGICSQRIGEKRAGCRHDEALSTQCFDLYALAEAVSEVLDLAEALRALDRITQDPKPRAPEPRVSR